MMNYIEYMEHIGMKLLSILSTAWGWAVGLVLLLVDFIAGHEMAVGLVVFVTLMDAVWGIAVSIKRKEDLAPGRFAYLSETRMNDLKAQGYEGTNYDPNYVGGGTKIVNWIKDLFTPKPTFGEGRYGGAGAGGRWDYDTQS